MYRGKKLNIKVSNPDGAQGGYKTLTLNDEKLPDNYIPYDKLKDENDILLIM